MSPFPIAAITIADHQSPIDAELPAPMLGLSANTDHPGLLDSVRPAP